MSKLATATWTLTYDPTLLAQFSNDRLIPHGSVLLHDEATSVADLWVDASAQGSMPVRKTDPFSMRYPSLVRKTIQYDCWQPSRTFCQQQCRSVAAEELRHNTKAPLTNSIVTQTPTA